MKTKMQGPDSASLKPGKVVSGSLALVFVLSTVFAGKSVQAQTYHPLYTFNGVNSANGSSPTSLVADRAGNVYGATSGGGAFGFGTIFKLSAAGKETVLYSFTGGADGGNPEAGLVRDAAGNLYGTAQRYGSSKCPSYIAVGCGTVFQLSPSRKLAILHAFTGADGMAPGAILFLDSKGSLYGTTILGGNNPNCSPTSPFPDGCGSVFKLTKNSAGKWRETVLYSFGGGGDGWQPSGGVLVDAAGNIYGATASGDSGCSMGPAVTCGNVFKLTRNGTGWTHTVLYSFTGGTDGAQPSSGLIQDSEGSLYGVTNLGGSLGFGTIFKLGVNHNKMILHSFTGSDGAYPFADLVRDAAGNLYGTTTEGGTSKVGTVFKLDTAGSLTVIHSFHGGSDGAYPFSTLFQDAGGNLYGATVLGGSKGQGTLFDIRKNNGAVTPRVPFPLE
jgi:uncharacterized repeat protein (TIGR03803 family)